MLKLEIKNMGDFIGKINKLAKQLLLLKDMS